MEPTDAEQPQESNGKPDEATSANAGNTDRSAFIAPYKWQPGQSGNPSGRPSRKFLTESLEKLLRETDKKTGKPNYELVMKALMAAARKGNVKALNLVLERMEGKVADELDLRASGEVKLVVPWAPKNPSNGV